MAAQVVVQNHKQQQQQQLAMAMASPVVNGPRPYVLDSDVIILPAAIGTPGAQKFAQVMVKPYNASAVLRQIISFIILELYTDRMLAPRLKRIRLLVLPSLAYITLNRINDAAMIADILLSAHHVSLIPGNKIAVAREITGALLREAGLVLTNNAQGEAPIGLQTGLADFMRLTAGFAPTYWKKPGDGYNWKQGNEISAHFLKYCDDLYPSIYFVRQLNNLLRLAPYSDFYFQMVLGESVDDVWKAYKRKFSGDL